MTEVTSEDTGTGVAPHGRFTPSSSPKSGSSRSSAWSMTAPRAKVRCGASAGATRRTTARNFSDVTSQAGFLDIELACLIVAAQATRNGTLFFTAHKAYLSSFLGIPYVYNYVELGNNCTPWSPESVIVSSSMALWMSQQGILASSMARRSRLLTCLNRPWIDRDDIDLINVRETACAVHVGDFSEFWWFFPQAGPAPSNGQAKGDSTTRKVGSPRGQMSRSAGITSSYTAQTVMADGSGGVLEHELGDFYNNAVSALGADI